MKIIPGYLYKYKSFDSNNYWKDILLKKRLYMARPSEFNDPFEGQLFPFGTATCGNSINLQAGQPNKDVKQFLDDYRVVCLSSNIRNKAMWAYYADNYQGFAIRFRTFKIGLYDNEKNSFSSVQRVIYKTDNEIIPCQRINGYRAAKAAQRKSLLYKSSDWKQEEEFRIIRYNKSGKNRYFHFDYSDIESVILGDRINIKNKQEITNICKRFDIRVRHMWLAKIDSRIEFYTDESPRFDGSDYRKYIDHDI